MRELQLGSVVARRSLAIADNRRPAAANWRVGLGNPDTVDLDTALDGANTKGDLVLGLLADSSDGLRLEHFWCLGFLALVDLTIFADPVAIVPKFQKAKENGDNLSLLAVREQRIVGFVVRTMPQAST